MSKKSKGDKPGTLSKKERKALEAREAELAAELAAREAADRKADKRDKKSAKKAVEASEKSNAKAAKKKAKGKTSVPEPVREATLIEAATGHEVPTPEGMTRSYALSLKNDDGRPVYFDRMMRDWTPLLEDNDDEMISGLTAHRHAVTDEPIIPIIDHTPDEIRVAAYKVLDDPHSSPGAREKATAALETADIKERVQAKAAERAKRAAEGTEVEHQQAHLKKGKKASPPLAAEPIVERVLASETVERIVETGVEKLGQVAEVVETEQGRVFETGTPAPERAFVNPSDAGPELEEGRNGYKIIQLGTDGKPDPRKVRQMTRVTTFVGNIDDETTLKKWDKRMVAEGLAKDSLQGGYTEFYNPLIGQVNDIAHRRDVKVAKAIKADRKGKLGIGEVGRLIAEAEKEAKDALDAIVEEAAALAGRNDKANFGTHLHTLAEISDEKGVDAVRQAHESGELVAHDNDGTQGLEPMPVTATDVASIEAYAERMARLGAKVIYSEAVIVNDEMGYAGRLDRIIMARLPELTLSDGTKRPADQRARRYVADIKSGRIDLGAGKIARQLAAYALGKVYDLKTGERTTHGAARDVALVFHLPQGEGVCTVHAVDLKAGTALLKLSAEVRRARNTGRKTIDTTVDIADPATDESGE